MRSGPLSLEWIYCLRDPRWGEIRYVGRSRNPRKRVSEHRYAPINAGVARWLHELCVLRLRPMGMILEQCPNRKEAVRAEQAWVDELEYAGARLENIKCTDTMGRRWIVAKPEISRSMYWRAEFRFAVEPQGLRNRIAWHLFGVCDQPGRLGGLWRGFWSMTEDTDGHIEVVPLLRSCDDCYLMTERGCFWASWCASLVRDCEGTTWVCSRPLLNGGQPFRVLRSELSKPPKVLR
jgi:hypothetical protein